MEITTINLVYQVFDRILMTFSRGVWSVGFWGGGLWVGVLGFEGVVGELCVRTLTRNLVINPYDAIFSNKLVLFARLPIR